MAKVVFRVTEVNDLSKDGASMKRIVLESKTKNYDGTGPAKDPVTGDVIDGGNLKQFTGPAVVDGKIELCMDNSTQLQHFTLDSLHVIDFGQAPPIEPTEAPDKTKGVKAVNPPPPLPPSA